MSSSKSRINQALKRELDKAYEEIAHLREENRVLRAQVKLSPSTSSVVQPVVGSITIKNKKE